MITEKDTIKCEAVFNEDRTHRYMWKRVWSKDKPMAAVLMLNPCLSDNIVTDTTTALVVNNIARLEKYGGVMTADTVAFNAVIHSGTDNCADTGVHTGCVAAAGQHTDSFYTHVLFLLS